MRTLAARLGLLVGLGTLLALGAAAAMPASVPANGEFALRVLGIEIAYPATTKSGDTYHTAGLRFAGIAYGDRLGVWYTDLQARGPMGKDNQPLHCTPESAMILTGGTWVLRTAQGEVRGQVTEGQAAFRPDLPVVGRCTGPVPVTITVKVTRSTGRYQAVKIVAIGNASIDHRIAPAILTADTTLRPSPSGR